MSGHLPAKVPSRAPSTMSSRAPSVTSAGTATGAVGVENVSFMTHMSAYGRGAVGVTGNLDDIATAAAELTGTPPMHFTSSLAHTASHTDDDRASDHSSHRSRSRSRSGSAGAGVGSLPGNSSITDAEALILSDDVTVWQVVKQFLLVGYPLSFSALAQFSLNTVIVGVNGKFLGDLELGGASLAVGLVNATGFAFGAGLCGALETVLSHTYGAYERKLQQMETDKATRAVEAAAAAAATTNSPSADPLGGGSSGHGAPPGHTPTTTDLAVAGLAEQSETPMTVHMYGTYAQRMCIILFIVAFPLGVILGFADMALENLGESGAVIYFTGVWCRIAVFGIPATLIYQLVQRYYSCQCVTKPLLVAMLAAALLNPVLQITFVLAFGFKGSPVAWLLLMSGTVAGLIGYLKYTGLYKLTWGGFNEKSTQNLGSLTALAIPSMGVMLSEWVALEVNALAAGFSSTEELAAFSITLQVFGIMWAVGSGVMILTCVFVGNAVGARKPLLARKISFIALGLVFCVASMNVIIFSLLGPFIPWLFTSDPKVVEIYHHLMYLVFPYHFFDTFQSTVMGIFRGCELQKLGACIISVAFCVVGVPLSFLLFFYFDIGVRALWIGPFVGVSCVGTPIYLYIITRYIKWEDLQPHAEEGLPVDEDEEAEEGAACDFNNNDSISHRSHRSHPAEESHPTDTPRA